MIKYTMIMQPTNKTNKENRIELAHLNETMHEGMDNSSSITKHINPSHKELSSITSLNPIECETYNQMKGGNNR